MTFLTKKALDRRTILRGVGTSLALPFLEAMTPALAVPKSAQSPMRLGWVYVPNGIIPKDWLPEAIGSDFEMKATMKPLEPFRDKLLVLSNMSHIYAREWGDGAGDHARAGATWLTGVHCKKTEGADFRAGVSADQIAARESAKYTQFGSLELGLEEPYFAGGCDSGYSCAYTNTLSWRTPTTPNPVEINPRAVFERLFGQGDSTDPVARLERMRKDRSVLDYVRHEISGLDSGLGAGDQRKLEEYLESIRDIERRIQMAEAQGIRPTPFMERPPGIPDEFAPHARLMSDLMVIAYQTDMTRVISFMMAREGSNRSFPEIGVPEGSHVVTHHQNDPEKIAKAQKVDLHRAESLAYLVERLNETEDGDGTLLDHTVLLYGAGICDGNSHNHDDLPLVLVGGQAAGIKGGRHIRYKPETPMSNLLVTMLDRARVPCDDLGDSTGQLQELSEV